MRISDWSSYVCSSDLLALEVYVDQQPARLFLLRFRIVVIGLRIELGRVRVRLRRNRHQAIDAGNLAARMVEEGLIPFLHLDAEHVAHLVLAYTVHFSGLLRSRCETVVRKAVPTLFPTPICTH